MSCFNLHWFKFPFQIFSIHCSLILSKFRHFKELSTTHFVLKRSYLSAINILLKTRLMLCLHNKEIFIAISVADKCNNTLNLKSISKSYALKALKDRKV